MPDYHRSYLMPAALFIGAALLTRPSVAADLDQLQADLARERAEIAQQRETLLEQERALEHHEERLRALETELLGNIRAAGAPRGSDDVETVGEAPDKDRPPPVAVLGDQGGIITRKGQLTLEPSVEYTHADRNRALFRGIEVVESVLIGVFDINESRQDLVTSALGARFGVSDRLEVAVRVPYIYRNDASALAPIQGSENPPGSGAGTEDTIATGTGIGDIEGSVRYQLTRGREGWPFFIAGLQVAAPTGSDPFKVRRSTAGAPLDAATGSGFWGISPNVTAILPSDPAVLFATVGYTRNLGRHVDTRIGSAQVDSVRPGDSISSSLGFGVSLNERTSLNWGYAHTWAFGTRTVTRVDQPAGPGQPPTLSAPIANISRDLQVGSSRVDLQACKLEYSIVSPK